MLLSTRSGRTLAAAVRCAGPPLAAKLDVAHSDPRPGESCDAAAVQEAFTF